MRFFTLKTIEELMARVNINIEKLYLLRRNIFGSKADVINCDVNVLSLAKLFNDELAWTYQFLLVVTRDIVGTEKRSFGNKNKHPLLGYLATRLRAKFE